MASGLSCPVGFKNGTDGNLKIAVDAIRAAEQPHHFLSLTMAAQSAIFSTTGNEDCHLILRGGKTPNYDATHIEQAANSLAKAKLPERVMVDFSHANSEKQPEKQVDVGRDIAAQIAGGDARIMGVMVESNLEGGRQDVVSGQPWSTDKASRMPACRGRRQHPCSTSLRKPCANGAHIAKAGGLLTSHRIWSQSCRPGRARGWRPGTSVA